MKTALDERVKALEGRLQVLEDERAIVQTLYRYSHTLDYGLEREWVDCFTEDGVFDVRRPVGPPGYRLEGRQDLTRWVAQDVRNRLSTYHKQDKLVMVEPRITLNGDEARVVSYMIRLDHENGVPYILTFGRYLDHMVRCPDGVWRFKERIPEIEARSKVLPYEKPRQ